MYIPATLLETLERLAERIGMYVDEIIINALHEYMGYGGKDLSTE